MSTLRELQDRLARVPEFCQEKIWPQIDSFQSEFKVDFSKLKAALPMAAPLLIGGFIAQTLVKVKAGSGAPVKLIAAAAFIAIIVGLFLIGKELPAILSQAAKRRAALRKLTAEIKLQSVQFLNPNFTLTVAVEFPKDLYHTCGIFPTSYDLSSAQDRCSGSVGATKFELTEIATHNVKRTKDSRGNTRTEYIPVFCGLLFQADFNKNFSGHTVVQTDTSESKFGFLARAGQRLKSSVSDLKLVELENPEFENHYKVSSTDATEARYIITPQFMEHLVRLKGSRGNVQVSFMQASIIVALPRATNFLEMTSGLENATESVSTMLTDLVSVLAIVEELELNSRIWNKQSQPVGA